MSVEKFVWIYCDYEECLELLDSEWSSIPMARRDARKAGWSSVRGAAITFDYCPKHAEAVAS
jgi:hypothetical protein